MRALSLSSEYPVSNSPRVVGRLAPSPSGRLHMGNILSFLIAALSCDQLVLRVEDLDPQRSKREHIDQLFRDLEYLGFEWEGPVFYQSKRNEIYREAFDCLSDRGLVYPCFCTRADLHSASAPHFGEEFVYANTCRSLTNELRQSRLNASKRSGSRKPAWRVVVPDEDVCFSDVLQGPQRWNLVQSSGDFIVRRSDGVYAYQLAVVVDDAAQGVTRVVRGVDLLSSAPRQLYLQSLFGFNHIEYGHVPLLISEEGVRLSKRNADASLSFLMDDRHLGAERILGHLAYLCGIVPEPVSMGIAELKKYACLDSLKNKASIVWHTIE